MTATFPDTLPADNSAPDKPISPCCRENGSDTELWIPDTPLGQAVARRLEREGWKPIKYMHAEPVGRGAMRVHHLFHDPVVFSKKEWEELRRAAAEDDGNFRGDGMPPDESKKVDRVWGSSPTFGNDSESVFVRYADKKLVLSGAQSNQFRKLLAGGAR